MIKKEKMWWIQQEDNNGNYIGKSEECKSEQDADKKISSKPSNEIWKKHLIEYGER